MARSSIQRDRGAVLVVSIITVLSIFVLSGVSLALSVREASAFNERVENTAALYLAEGAVARAQWEFSELQDPDADGFGTAAWSEGNKSYDVVLTPLSSGTFLISAVATVGGETVSLEVFGGGEDVTTRWPEGAISILGEVDKLKFQWKVETNLILDGGDTPAIRVSDLDTYNDFLADFVKALDDGLLPPANLTGTPETDVNGTKVPIAYNPDYEDELKELTDLYDKLVTEVNTLRPIADIVIQDADDVVSTYGDPDNPVTVYVPTLGTFSDGKGKEIFDQTITGYGDLILGHKFKVNNTDFNWTGNIYVVGDDSKNAEFEIKNGSTFDLDGNLTILGEGYDSAKFKVKEASIASVNGAVFLGTDWQQRKKQKAEFKVEKDGNFALNGVMTLVGPRVKVECKEKGDDGSDETNVMDITGMLQIGLPPVAPPPVPDCSKNCETQFQLGVSGLIEIHRDIELMEQGMKNLETMGISLNAAPEMEKIYKKKVDLRTWKKVAPLPVGGSFMCPVHGKVFAHGHENHSL